MRQLISLSFILALTLLGACSKGSQTPAKFSITLGAVAGLNIANGGLVIYGKDAVGNAFGRVVTTPEIMIDLKNGNWSFYAIAWDNSTAKGNMTGVARCAETSAVLSGNPVSINLNLKNSNCDTASFRGAYPMANEGSYQFTPVSLYSCNKIGLDSMGQIGCIANDNTLMGRQAGHASGYKFSIRSFDAPLGGAIVKSGTPLESNCMAMADVSGMSGSVDYEAVAPNIQEQYLQIPTAVAFNMGLSLKGFLSSDNKKCDTPNGIVEQNLPAGIVGQYKDAGNQNTLYESYVYGGTNRIYHRLSGADICNGERLVRNPFAAGTGTANQPYVICSMYQLTKISFSSAYESNRSKSYILGKNLNGWAGQTVPQGPSQTAIGIGEYIAVAQTDDDPFTGSFEGNGHSIIGWGLRLDEGSTEIENVGFFRSLAGQVANLTLIAPEIEVGHDETPVSNIGFVAGRSSGSINNVTVIHGHLRGGSQVGGLVGLSSVGGQITNSKVQDSEIEAFKIAGGLVGKISGGAHSNGQIYYSKTSNVNIELDRHNTYCFEPSATDTSCATKAYWNSNEGRCEAGYSAEFDISDCSATGGVDQSGFYCRYDTGPNASEFNSPEKCRREWRYDKQKCLVQGLGDLQGDDEYTCTNMSYTWVSGQVAGGLVGIIGDSASNCSSSFAMINDSTAHGTIVGRTTLGGLVGTLYSSGYCGVKNSYSTASMIALNREVSGMLRARVGGLFGKVVTSSSTVMENSFHAKGAIELAGTRQIEPMIGMIPAGSSPVCVNSFGRSSMQINDYMSAGNCNHGKTYGNSRDPINHAGVCVPSNTMRFVDGYCVDDAITEEGSCGGGPWTWSTEYERCQFLATYVMDDPYYDIPRLYLESPRLCHGKFHIPTEQEQPISLDGSFVNAGSSSNPYVICSASQLQLLSQSGGHANYNSQNVTNKHFILGDDLDAQEVSLSSEVHLLDEFSAKLDGKNRSINNFYVNANQANAAIIEEVAEGAEIKNLRILASRVDTGSSSAPNSSLFVATNSGLLDRIIVNGQLSPLATGGAIIGTNTSTGKLRNSEARAILRLESASNSITDVGSLVGSNSGEVAYSSSDSTIIANTLGASSNIAAVGGLVGLNAGTIKESSYYGRLLTQQTSIASMEKIGGIAGVNTSAGVISDVASEYDFSYYDQLPVVSGNDVLPRMTYFAGTVGENTGTINRSFTRFYPRVEGGCTRLPGAPESYGSGALIIRDIRTGCMEPQISIVDIQQAALDTSCVLSGSTLTIRYIASLQWGSLVNTINTECGGNIEASTTSPATAIPGATVSGPSVLPMGGPGQINNLTGQNWHTIANGGALTSSRVATQEGSNQIFDWLTGWGITNGTEVTINPSVTCPSSGFAHCTNAYAGWSMGTSYGSGTQTWVLEDRYPRLRRTESDMEDIITLFNYWKTQP